MIESFLYRTIKFYKNFGFLKTVEKIIIKLLKFAENIYFNKIAGFDPLLDKHQRVNPLTFKFLNIPHGLNINGSSSATIIIFTSGCHYDYLCLRSILAWCPSQVNEIFIVGSDEQSELFTWIKKISEYKTNFISLYAFENPAKHLNTLVEKSLNDHIVMLSGLSIPAPGMVDQLVNNLVSNSNSISAVIPVTNNFRYSTQALKDQVGMNQFLENAEMLYRMRKKMLTSVSEFDGLCLGISKRTWNNIGRFDDSCEDFYFSINNFLSKARNMKYSALCIESALLHSYNFELSKNQTLGYYFYRSLIFKSSIKKIIDLLNITDVSVDILFAIFYNSKYFDNFTSDLFPIIRLLSIQKEMEMGNPFFHASNTSIGVIPQKRRKILFVTSQFPNPQHGGGLRVLNFIKILSMNNEIYLATSFSLLDSRFLPEIEPYCCSIYKIDSSQWGNNQLEIIRWLNNNYMDIVHYEWPLSLKNYDPAYGRYHIFTYMEAVSLRVLMDMNRLRPLSEMWLKKFIELVSFLRIEISDASLMDERIAVTLKDAEFLYKFFPYQNFSIVNHGVNFDEFCISDVEPEANTLVFVGNYQHYPNHDAMKFFFDEIWDIVRREVKDVRIYVVGASPTKDLISLNNDTSIIVTGQVDDIRPYIQKATIGIAPLISGAGMRGKVIDYAALRRTFVATSIATTDLAFEHGRDYICADNVQDFADSIIRLLKNYDKAKAMGQSAFNIAMNNYDNRLFINYLNHIYDNLDKKNNA